MWGFGGTYYWGGQHQEGRGIVVVFAWMSSQEKHLKNFVHLYSSLRWSSLVCHSQCLNMFFPDQALRIASDLLNELVKELKVRPRPVVFAAFSGGPKACMYKLLQILDQSCDSQILTADDCTLVRDCISGYIFDSSPVDYTSDVGTRFFVHPSVLKFSHPPKLASWVAKYLAVGFDSIFLSTFESDRADYWQTLYSSVSFGAPYLILCSDIDDLAPSQTICNFAQRLKELGGDVKLVKWSDSPHVGHFKHYPVDYKAAVSEILDKANAVYCQRSRQIEGETTGDMSKPMEELRKAAEGLHQSFKGTPLVSNEHFLFPNSIEYYQGKDVGPMGDEQQGGLIHLPSLQTIDTHGVLGQILFDVCIPENVDDWDIRSSDSENRQLHACKRPFNRIKCIRRPRL